jgi:hypothetical protein
MAMPPDAEPAPGRLTGSQRPVEPEDGQGHDGQPATEANLAVPGLPPPDARTALVNRTVVVPLPNTHLRAVAVRVPGWDDFVASLLPGSTPLKCPGVIQPRGSFGKVPYRFHFPGDRKPPLVLVYAPGCTPLAATGVDATGV